MKKIEAVIRPGKLDEIQKALDVCGIHGMTVSQVLGCGMQKGYSEVYRGNEVNIRLLPKVKLEIVIADEQVAQVVKVLTETARTGKVGDGKIFISNVESVIRIRTGESDQDAL